MIDNAIEFAYKIPGNASGIRPGAHASRRSGSGMVFASHAKLFDVPDPRRLDFRASFADVNRDWLVRRHHQRSTIHINVIADVSASMHFGSPSKLHVVVEFLQALGNSAQRYGDSVSLCAYDNNFRKDLYQPSRTGRSAGVAMCSAITTHMESQPLAGHSQALIDTVNHVDSTKGLTFLLSDFHWDLEILKSILPRFTASCLVPVVLWNQSELQPPGNSRWLPLRDMESGVTKHLLLTSSVRARWHANIRKRRQAITELLTHHDIRPIFVVNEFKPDDFTRYFMESMA